MQHDPIPLFYGIYGENPSLHLDKLEETCTSDEVVLMRLFPLSLRDAAERWFYSLNHDMIHTWEFRITNRYRCRKAIFEKVFSCL